MTTEPKPGRIHIIPAIDLMDGQCVRLKQGRKDSRVVYSDDPVSVAKKWEQAGAVRLHIVDLDGAFSGEPKNSATIKNIRKAVSMEIEVGGGIREPGQVENYVRMGVNYVILGTRAFQDQKWLRAQIEKYGAQIIVGLDARDGQVASHGWIVTEKTPATSFARELEKLGCQTIIYTDVARDGMLTGPNLPALSKMADSVDIQIIASGGISTIEDVRNILSLKRKNIIGIITGKAIYENTLDLKEALAEAEKSNYNNSQK